MRKVIFVTGIGTDVGKTVVSAIVCRSLSADYWKPVQAGDLDDSDSMKVKSYSPQTYIHKESYRLNTAASPHWAAAIDKVEIDLKKIKRPHTNNPLLIEGAGGLMVPLNNSEIISSLIEPTDYVILVSRNYLGSINHTLLSLAHLERKKTQKIGIIFLGNEAKSTQEIIKQKTKAKIIGRIDETEELNKSFIVEQSEKIKPCLENFLSDKESIPF